MKFFFEHDYSSRGCHGDNYKPNGAVRCKIIELLDQMTQFKGDLSFGGTDFRLLVLPKLFVKNVGPISLPMLEEDSEELISHGKLVGFKVREIPGNQVQMKNSQWAAAINHLCAKSTTQLGYAKYAKAVGCEGAVLQPVLSKLLLIGAGGQLGKSHDVEVDDNCVGKLVVQLPSEFCGGGLVVFEGGRRTFCYDFGKEEGTTRFASGYAVYAAGAEYAVEEVGSGYWFAAVYSLCVPAKLASAREQKNKKQLMIQLAESLAKLGDFETSTDNAAITLMLSTQCKKNDVEILGAEALSGVDRERFQALQQANALVPLDKQLLFYIACLQYNVNYSREEKEVDEEMSWLSNKGDILGKGNPLKWSTNLNLLNSGNDALSESGNANTTRGQHERFAIVAWPASKDIGHKLTFMGEIAATTSALTYTPIDVTRLQHFFLLDAHQFREDSEKQLLPLSLFKTFCQTVATSGDLTLANEFFSIYFPRLKNKDDIIPELATLVRNAGWEGITYLFMYAVDQLDERFDLTLKLIRELGDCHVAQIALTTFVVEQARLAMDLHPVPRAFFDNISSLWKAASECKNPQLLLDLSNVLQRIDGGVIGAYIDRLSKCVDQSSIPEHRIALAGIVTRRREWLIAQQDDQKCPPVWGVSESPFPDSAAITSFLGGPLISLIIRGFVDIGAASARATSLRKDVKGPLNISASGSGLDSFVQLLKFHGMKASCTTEINRLDNLLDSLRGNENDARSAAGTIFVSTRGRKRPRDKENGTAL